MNHYDILEVVPSASVEVITAAYRAKARKLHPDMVPADRKTWAEAQFKRLNEAYHVLSNDESRAAYDLSLKSSQPEEPPASYAWAGQSVRTSATKIGRVIEYLGMRGPTHYTVIADDVRRLYPETFPPDYTAKKVAASLSAELRRYGTPLVRVGNGYFSVRR